MWFREHRGGLAESMATAREFQTFEEFVEHLLPLLPGPQGGHHVKIKPYGGPDERIGWADTHIVTCEGYGVVGFTDGPVPGFGNEGALIVTDRTDGG